MKLFLVVNLCDHRHERLDNKRTSGRLPVLEWFATWYVLYLKRRGLCTVYSYLILHAILTFIQTLQSPSASSIVIMLESSSEAVAAVSDPTGRLRSTIMCTGNECFVSLSVR